MARAPPPPPPEAPAASNNDVAAAAASAASAASAAAAASTSTAADEFFPAESARLSGEVERVTPGLEIERKASQRAAVGGDTAILPRLLDASGVLQDAASAIIDDTFNKCFTQTNEDSWNWNFYLFPVWSAGMFLRYFVLFPIRFVGIVMATLLFAISFIFVHNLLRGKMRIRWERGLVHLYAMAHVVSWTSVIKYHGPKPTKRSGHVYVCNHTSMIDYIVLSQVTPFSAIAQQNYGIVGLLQNTAMEAIQCIAFNRAETKDREMVQRRLREHVQDPDRLPLLIFPEGTCVNNEYCVLFKRGAFDLGCKVCPIAIKYNKVFSDPFWHSRRQTFPQHLITLMQSWAVVADVWYMEPQEMQPGETGIEFSERVRLMICKQAGLKPVPWDGMLKYYRPSPRMCEKRRAEIASSLVQLLPPKINLNLNAGAGAADGGAGGVGGGGGG
eukprot:CAMPEP_0197597888 /NCGR_PEP_ID=MMETSP1326-20131121/28192_1 /TAXON_ID=1155430 /ORGANISM="Genus nov. species nov., Strain RCC2288" /LENGTH=442 /DNA_ID=CAMNT_0043164617 /DNA_START=258 /DNA_END=1582 /DNA_ORIENTATION=+